MHQSSLHAPGRSAGSAGRYIHYKGCEPRNRRMHRLHQPPVHMQPPEVAVVWRVEAVHREAMRLTLGPQCHPHHPALRCGPFCRIAHLMLHYMIAVQVAHALLTVPFRLHTPCPGPLLVLATERKRCCNAVVAATERTGHQPIHAQATTRYYACRRLCGCALLQRWQLQRDGVRLVVE